MMFPYIAYKALVHQPASLTMLLLATAAGIGFQISNKANLTGYTEELFQKGVINSTGHIWISAQDGDVLTKLSEKIALIRAHKYVKNVHPRFLQPGAIFAKDANYPVNIVGIDPELEQKSNAFCHRIAQGTCLTQARERSVVLGNLLAEKLNIHVGQIVRLILPYEELGDITSINTRCRVIGILEPGGGFSATDYGVFIRLEDIQQLLGMHNTATNLEPLRKNLSYN